MNIELFSIPVAWDTNGLATSKDELVDIFWKIVDKKRVWFCHEIFSTTKHSLRPIYPEVFLKPFDFRSHTGWMIGWR